MSNTDAMMIRIASAHILGATNKEISMDVGLSVQKIVKILNTPECQEYIKTLGEKALTDAKAKIKEQTAMLVPEIVETLRAHLKDRNLNALPHALKILGFNDEEKNTGSTSIQVIMPTSQDIIDITPKE